MSPHPHASHLPFAHEPWKTLYVTQRLTTTLLLVPIWVTYYLLMPRTSRPRKSWSIKQIVAVRFTRRVHKVTEMAGVVWGVRDHTEEPKQSSLKETRFQWIDPLPKELQKGIVNDSQVPCIKVGTFVWPRDPKNSVNGFNSTQSTSPLLSSGTYTQAPVHVDLEDTCNIPMIGIFMHGGGYCHMSAGEKSPTSKIPRRLTKDGRFTEIYSVEYRLLHQGSFPSAIQDAAAVYYHIVEKYSKHGCRIILIGDSSGGNLVLSTARWLRDENLLPPPDGLLLLSPSCDPSHAFPFTTSSYIPRPHESTDYLVDTPEPRALLLRTLLGHHPTEVIHSPYLSPASERVLREAYGDEEFEKIAAKVGVRTNEYALAHFEQIRAEAEAQARAEAEGIPLIITEDPTKTPSIGCPTTSAISTPNSTPNSTPRIPGSLLKRPQGPLLVPSYCHSDVNLPLLRKVTTVNPRQLALFEDFARTCVVLGDAERLETEVLKLVGAMEHDGVEVEMIGAKDAVHDILMMGWWDEVVREGVWKSIDEWLATFSNPERYI
ncbi:alpha/beta-hydrolase [Thelephora ganbajun]|uniref:Alpha/beta-hydrolase n=1 Tax=Thelephora ganbajun TaxID=370292 RepID=A0ACB6ZTL9_THEGA|nr:alpha/beta-hydrolase [Thelephora ganbajun]